MEIFPSHGGAPFSKTSLKVIRLILRGCVNRPFFHISVQESFKDINEPVIEQLGNYDPLPNKYNEKLVAVNFQRLEYWLREGAVPSDSVKKLLGLCGYFPVHHHSFREAYMRRKKIADVLEKLKITAAEISESRSLPEEVNKLHESNNVLSKNTFQNESESAALTKENSQISPTKETLPKDNSYGREHSEK